MSNIKASGSIISALAAFVSIRLLVDLIWRGVPAATGRHSIFSGIHQSLAPSSALYWLLLFVYVAGIVWFGYLLLRGNKR
ncbi:hypothetical protein [Lysobacter sp. Root494]|uniref:hypothetical protein n=1 Tax=Lysobacter sp. Root494 TaxID=1736549 RepID=UPI0006F49C43|nr:hypothetical protein [Lysobacter sp. Root494]KQY48649.1 hypothetical protein ASD14_15540 [Lysobacter sp. Root494]